MCISHPLDARVAALRAAVGCGWMYRRNAAWAWRAMPICAFRRSCTLPCTPCTLSCTPFLAIVCSLNPDLSGVLGLVHTMHTIFQVLYMAKIYTSLVYIYMSLKKRCAWRAGRQESTGKAHEHEKSPAHYDVLLVCSEVCMACRRCAAHVGMAPLFLGVLLLPPTFQGVRANFF